MRTCGHAACVEASGTLLAAARMARGQPGAVIHVVTGRGPGVAAELRRAAEAAGVDVAVELHEASTVGHFGAHQPAGGSREVMSRPLAAEASGDTPARGA